MNKALYEYYRKEASRLVKEQRELQNLSYYEIKKLSGVATNVIQSIENADKDYTFKSLCLVCDALGIKVKFSLFGK